MYAFTPNWSGKVECDLGLQGWTAASRIVAAVNIKRQLNLFAVRINYKF